MDVWAEGRRARVTKFQEIKWMDGDAICVSSGFLLLKVLVLDLLISHVFTSIS